ncbi:MAG: GNAT family N-acetyltransferase [Candidatus Pseudobacter hemicellulosilyticus]|uniref:GNAT family N-acetyltransferase n=1 Tax=Candidatus Pseudobacter hemicellulosilyticus TaxID=3121375 RepID=A0AAJ5WUC7_9BACT|nr:MAG: GNAT family N-acetyltransferase [Pseudobacter sp.]
MLQIVTIAEETGLKQPVDGLEAEQLLFRGVDPLELIRALFREYEEGLGENLCFQSFSAELENPLKKYGPPGGCLLLAVFDGEPAGCAAFTPMADAGACEMKRLYVRPGFRAHGIAAALVRDLLDQAVAAGYRVMRLDTLERLQPAIRLYERFGFKRIEAYYENPLAEVVYMEKRFE